MNELAQTILSAKRRRLLRSHPIFERSAPVSEAELFRLATGLNFKFPLGLSKWLLLAGYGNIDDALSFRESYFSIIDWEPLRGYIVFAQDASGNHYAFNPEDGSIYFISFPERRTARISSDFPSFFQELIRRDYQLTTWMNSLPLSK